MLPLPQSSTMESTSINTRRNGENEEYKAEQNLILNVRRSRTSATQREFLFQNIHNGIPKQITTFDDMFVLRCLELIRNYAIRASTRNLTETSNRNSCEMTKLAIDSTGDWTTIGALTRSPSMINILKSPLLQEFGPLNFDANFGRKRVYSRFIDSSHKVQNEVAIPDRVCARPPEHKRVVSISSTNSNFSDKSSSSSSSESVDMFRGMLQCKWKDGLPHHVFTLDDTREVYVSHLAKVESRDDKVLDYVYTLSSRKNGRKDLNALGIELEIVGKMCVCSSITMCSDDSQVMETRFLLSAEVQSSSKHTLGKDKRLTRKVVDKFKSNLKKKFSAISEDSYSEEGHNGLDVEYSHETDVEVAAIIVKDRIVSNDFDLEGWGMKFLKKSGNNNASSKTSLPSKGTKLDVLIPSGFHGGSRTRNGGPSSLIERWISGGRCDCGGWDIGCPLTILNTPSRRVDSSFPNDDSWECKSIDLFVKGSQQNLPMMKMVNIHEDLYYIHFQSNLSILQSFAIAAAIIHSRSPVLRPNVYRS